MTGGRWASGRIVFLVPIVTGALGLLAAASLFGRERDQDRDRDQRAASVVATALARAISTNIDGLRGASGLVADDGEISAAEMASFGADVRRGTSLSLVAHQVLVPDADRAAFEEARGFEIIEVSPDGQQVRAGRRDEYAPVVAVEYDNPQIQPSYGLDILGDPLRAEAVRSAEADDLPTLSRPITLTRTGRIGYLGVTTVRGADGTLVGFVTANFAVDDIVASARAAVDPAVDVTVIDDGVLVTGTDDRGGGRSVVAIGGRTIEVRADDPRPIGIWPAIVVAAGALGSAAALAVAIRGLRRSERAASTLAAHLDSERSQALGLADLGRELTAAQERADVVALLEAHLTGVTGADEATVSFVDGDLLRPVGGAGLVPLETHLPTTDAVRSSGVVMVDDVDAFHHGHTDLRSDARARRVRSAAAVPLLDTNGTSFGVLGLEWHAARTFGPADEVMLTTLGSLVAGTVQRVEATADAVRHADALARLAEELTLATTIDQVVSASASHLPAISDASDVHLSRTSAASDEPDGGDRHVLTDTSGDTVGELVVAWPGEGPDSAQQERLQTAIGLIDETVRRVDIQRTTSGALLSLRQRLLRPLPTPAGLDLAARYRPTSRPLGMGGDWYDVIERGDGTIGIVIGDVVGHGIGAIAAMLHVSTIVGGLVRAGTALPDIVDQAGAMLDTEGMIATVQVLIVDPAGDELAMISAGHPPPLLRRPGGSVERLPEATHAPLGVATGGREVVRVPFPPGSAVLGYTDGLVERRDQPIDVGIDRLEEVFASTDGSVWGTVSDVLRVMVPVGEDVLDDIAVVVARHRDR